LILIVFSRFETGDYLLNWLVFQDDSGERSNLKKAKDRFWKTVAVLVFTWIFSFLLITVVVSSRNRGSGRCVNVIGPSGGRIYSLLAGGNSPVQPVGIGFIPPRQKGSSNKGSGSEKIRGLSSIRQSGFLRPYSVYPGCVSFTGEGEPFFIPHPPKPGPPIQPTVIRRVEQAGNRIALTFDTGTMKEPRTRLLIDKLTELKIPATFFVCGAWCPNNKELLKLMARRNFEIASHSLTHAWFTRISDAEIENELRQTEALVRDTCGRELAAYFRPPFGAMDERVRQVVARCGYLIVMWSKDARDWEINVSSSQIISNVISGLHHGDIILMHTMGDKTVSVLPQLVNEIRSRGLELTTVSGLLFPE